MEKKCSTRPWWPFRLVDVQFLVLLVFEDVCVIFFSLTFLRCTVVRRENKLHTILPWPFRFETVQFLIVCWSLVYLCHYFSAVYTI